MCSAFRKIVFLLLCGLAYCGISAVPAFARGGMHHGFPDSPHNTTSGTLCLSCHDVSSPDPKLIPDDPDTADAIFRHWNYKIVSSIETALKIEGASVLPC